jgi:hypothetical protein
LGGVREAGRKWGVREGGKGGEVTQTLYTHMNIIKKEKKSALSIE